MEQHNPHMGGSPPEQQPPGFDPNSDALSEAEEARLVEHVHSVVEIGAPLDDTAARSMAVLLHEGEGSALFALARDGGIRDIAAVHAEIAIWRQEGAADRDAWLDALTRYIDHREDHEPVDGWQQLWPLSHREAEPMWPATDEDAVARAELMARIKAAGVTTLGEVATILEPRADHLNDGWHWMEHLPEGWKAHGSWGRDGWDLGAWPYAIIAIYDDPEQQTFAYAVYTEGDVGTITFESQEQLYEAVDDIAEYQWRIDPERAPDDLPADDGLLPHHRDPFSWKRMTVEKPGSEAADRRTPEQREPRP